MARQTSVLTMMGLIFKESRLEKNITQSSIAKHIGMTSAGWGKLENGKASLSVENMMLVCSFLEIPPTQLFSSIEILTKDLENEGWDVHINRIDNDGLLIGKELGALSEVATSSVTVAGSTIITGGAALAAGSLSGSAASAAGLTVAGSTLSGAAASSASLAALGGGSLAAGGGSIGMLVRKIASAYVWGEKLLSK